jgi:hypothetical protein
MILGHSAPEFPDGRHRSPYALADRKVHPRIRGRNDEDNPAEFDVAACANLGNISFISILPRSVENRRRFIEAYVDVKY